MIFAHFIGKKNWQNGRTIAPTVPLIVISGSAFPDRAPSLDATRCRRKPFRPATLLGVIDGFLSEAERRFTGIGLLAHGERGAARCSRAPQDEGLNCVTQ
jgi:hypothetical protein